MLGINRLNDAIYMSAVAMIRNKASLLLLIFIISWMMIPPTSNAQTEPVMTVAVSIAPLAGIIESIGAGYIETTVLLSEGVEPHAFTVDPTIIAMADDADLLALTGHYHWETSLANSTSTPYISFHDENALRDYADFGARLSSMPRTNPTDNGDLNPHAYWLLPTNAIAIANATRSIFKELAPLLSSVWDTNFEKFVDDINDLDDLIELQDSTYHFSDLHAVVVFPAEAYVAEAFGIQVDAVLMVEGVTISGHELIEVQNAMSNGSIQLILGSDVAKLQAGGEFAYQLQEDYGCTLIWLRAVFFSGLRDYVSIMTYNLGALTSGLEDRSQAGVDSNIVLLLTGLAGVFGLLLVLETFLLVQRGRRE